jgi:hypothetical protein
LVVLWIVRVFSICPGSDEKHIDLTFLPLNVATCALAGLATGSRIALLADHGYGGVEASLDDMGSCVAERRVSKHPAAFRFLPKPTAADSIGTRSVGPDLV